MAKIIAIVNQKGGVGKTTTTVNLTAALSALGKRVLLCDFDPQANATSGMGVDKNTASPNVYDILINGADPKKSVCSTKYGDVIPSNKALAGAGIEMIAIPDREHLLKKGAGRPGAPVRLHLHRLPPFPGAAHRQRAVCGPLPAGPRPVRVLRPGGSQ